MNVDVSLSPVNDFAGNFGSGLTLVNSKPGLLSEYTVDLMLNSVGSPGKAVIRVVVSNEEDEGEGVVLCFDVGGDISVTEKIETNSMGQL